MTNEGDENAVENSGVANRKVQLRKTLVLNTINDNCAFRSKSLRKRDAGANQEILF